MHPIQFSFCCVILIAGTFASPTGSRTVDGVHKPNKLCEFGSSAVNKTEGHMTSIVNAQPVPYTVKASTKSYGNDVEIEVTISGIDEAIFKGFLIKAIDVNTDAFIGTWTEVNSETKFIDDCAAIFRTDFTPTNSYTSIWRPPTGLSGTVKFIATIVKDRQNLWTDIEAI